VTGSRRRFCLVVRIYFLNTLVQERFCGGPNTPCFPSKFLDALVIVTSDNFETLVNGT